MNKLKILKMNFTIIAILMTLPLTLVSGQIANYQQKPISHGTEIYTQELKILSASLYYVL
jgi:hypothetical protein